MADQIVEVQVQPDHLQKLVRVKPIRGVAELIWNAVDADAMRVDVAVQTNVLGGVDQVVVRDDGLGMTHRDALEGFAYLGGSWKRSAERTSSHGRFLHGREGKGRWAAFALGPTVRWVSTARVDGHFEMVTITGRSDALGRFQVSDPVSSNGPAGTIVTVSGIAANPTGLMADNAIDELAGWFALYLEQYPSIEIVFRGDELYPDRFKAASTEYDVEIEDQEPAKLTIIEWQRPVDRALYLCDEHGTTLEEIPPRIQAPGFDFTSYLSWASIGEYQGVLGLADLGTPVLGELVEAARDRLREHFRERLQDRTRGLITTWEEEQVWPYPEAPTSLVERVERELFEVVAVTAAPAVNRSSDRQSRKLSLRLLRQALEDNPKSLSRVLTEVLDLPAERVDELAKLLERTTLTQIITVARTVAERLDFIAGLELMLFDPDVKKTTLERSQLHRMLAGETWIFGEEYAIVADDESLTTVLRRHVKLLGRDALADESEVVDDEGRRQIVDLMLARSMENHRHRREHLVVELKRPSVRLNSDELTQIQRYADAVTEDQRFDTTTVHWDFVVVVNELHDFAKKRLQAAREPGLVEDRGRVRIWVRTWADVIEECQHRLKFVQAALEYTSDAATGRDYLREVHGKYLPSALQEPVDED